jgi:hypothetical protein
VVNVLFRFSGDAAPDVTAPEEWGLLCVDNIDPATGVSLVMPYQATITLSGVGRYLLRIDQISGSHGSAIVWTDGAGATGSVSFQRQGGT